MNNQFWMALIETAMAGIWWIIAVNFEYYAKYSKIKDRIQTCINAMVWINLALAFFFIILGSAVNMS